MSTLNLKTIPRLRRLIVAACVCALGSSASFAEGTVKALMVQLKAGDTHYYVLSEQPVVTFEGQKCHITSPSLQSSYEMPDIDFANFVDYDPASVKETMTALTVEYITPQLIAVRGLDAGSRVSLYRLDGVKAGDYAADNAGSVEISLAALTDGVYIISCKEKTFKILHNK